MKEDNTTEILEGMKINHARGIRWETGCWAVCASQRWLLSLVRCLVLHWTTGALSLQRYILSVYVFPLAGGRAIRGAMFALDAKPLQLTAHIPPGDVFGTAATCLFASVCKWDYHGDENDDDDEDDGDNKDQGF